MPRRLDKTTRGAVFFLPGSCHAGEALEHFQHHEGIRVYHNRYGCPHGDIPSARHTRREGTEALQEAGLRLLHLLGIFRYRSRDGLISHSGLLCIDIDHVGSHLQLDDLRKRLIDDEQFLTELWFVSPSGDGLKWVVSINTELYPHELWFDATRQYLLDRYGIDADKACRDVSRACFLPHDPGCYVRR